MEIEFAVVVLKVANKYFTPLISFFTVVCTGFG